MEKKTLLIVDESVRVGEVTRAALEKELNVIEARDPEEALRLFDAKRPEAVLLEIEFQGKPRGWKLLEGIRERRPETVVLIITRYSGAEKDPWAREADWILKKPASLFEIRRFLGEKGILSSDSSLRGD